MLDLVFSKNEFEIEEISYLAPIGKSDHSVLLFDFALEGFVEVDDEPFAKKKYFKADYEEMYNELLPVDWSFMSEEEDVQARWGTFINKHDEMVEKYVPVGLSSG